MPACRRVPLAMSAGAGLLAALRNATAFAICVEPGTPRESLGLSRHTRSRVMAARMGRHGTVVGPTRPSRTLGDPCAVAPLSLFSISFRRGHDSKWGGTTLALSLVRGIQVER